MTRKEYERFLNEFLDGTQANVFLNPGNMGNPPGGAPVQVSGNGGSGFIPDYAYQGIGHVMTDIQSIPPDYRDWGQIGLNVGDPSGLTGGGISNTTAVDLAMERLLWVDPKTQFYYDLGNPYNENT